jgi:hypothetical protein
MDNGLIFPYRRSSAHDEAGDAKCPKPPIRVSSFGRVRMGVERMTRSGSSQAMG